MGYCASDDFIFYSQWYVLNMLSIPSNGENIPSNLQYSGTRLCYVVPWCKASMIYFRMWCSRWGCTLVQSMLYRYLIMRFIFNRFVIFAWTGGFGYILLLFQYQQTLYCKEHQDLVESGKQIIRRVLCCNIWSAVSTMPSGPNLHSKHGNIIFQLMPNWEKALNFQPAKDF